MFIGLALMFGWWLASTSAWQLAAFAFIYGTCYGGFVALVPAVTVDYLGARNGPALAGFAYDAFQSYTLPIAISAAAALIAALCTGLLRDPEAWRAEALA